jgi:hypothetical protein
MLLNRSSGFGVGPTINPCTKVPQDMILILMSLGSLDLGSPNHRPNARRGKY